MSFLRTLDIGSSPLPLFCCFVVFCVCYIFTTFFGWSVLGDDLAAGVVQHYRDLPWTSLNVKMIIFFSYSDYIICQINIANVVFRIFASYNTY